MTAMDGRSNSFAGPGILLGVGIAGFVDGILLHQLLQWHRMLSGTYRYPMTTVAGLKANTLADGLFQVLAYAFTIAGAIWSWKVANRRQAVWSTRRFIGTLLIGFGGFNLIEGLINHQLLGLHHVRDDVAGKGVWDAGFLIWSAAMLLGGVMLWRGARDDRAVEDVVRLSLPDSEPG